MSSTYEFRKHGTILASFEVDLGNGKEIYNKEQARLQSVVNLFKQRHPEEVDNSGRINDSISIITKKNDQKN